MKWLTPRRRTAVLLLLLGVAILATRVRRLSDWSPFASRRRAIDAAARRLDLAEERAMQVEVAQSRLDQARLRSLPPDPSRAATLYHAWLIERLDECGHEDAQLTPGRIGHENADFARIPFTIESLCTEESLSAFLDEFAGSGLLHKILALRIRPDEERTDRLRATIDLEALSLRDAEPRDGLMPDSAPATLENLQKGQLLAALGRDPFHLTADDAAESSEGAAEPEFVEAPDRTGETLLIATLHRNGVPEAWLYDRTLRTQHVLRAGEQNPLLGRESRLLAIHRDRIEFEKEGKHFRLDLGKRLSEAGALEH